MPLIHARHAAGALLTIWNVSHGLAGLHDQMVTFTQHRALALVALGVCGAPSRGKGTRDGLCELQVAHMSQLLVPAPGGDVDAPAAARLHHLLQQVAAVAPVAHTCGREL